MEKVGDRVAAIAYCPSVEGLFEVLEGSQVHGTVIGIDSFGLFVADQTCQSRVSVGRVTDYFSKIRILVLATAFVAL